LRPLDEASESEVSWVSKAYSSYQNQQQMLERIEVLEHCVAILIRGAQRGSDDFNTLMQFVETVTAPKEPE
jgi:hypothetical protein